VEFSSTAGQNVQLSRKKNCDIYFRAADLLALRPRWPFTRIIAGTLHGFAIHRPICWFLRLGQPNRFQTFLASNLRDQEKNVTGSNDLSSGENRQGGRNATPELPPQLATGTTRRKTRGTSRRKCVKGEFGGDECFMLRGGYEGGGLS
jgi:hypothetical protein